MSSNSDDFENNAGPPELPPNPYGDAPDMGPRGKDHRLRAKARQRTQQRGATITGGQQYAQGMTYDGAIASIQQCLRDSLVSNEPRHQNEFRDFFWFANVAFFLLSLLFSDSPLLILAFVPFVPLYSAANRQIRRGAVKDASYYLLWFFPINIWGLMQLTKSD